MISIGVREAKNRLSEYLRKVKAGERVEITERGKPIAVITGPRDHIDERLEDMIREGDSAVTGEADGRPIHFSLLQRHHIILQGKGRGRPGESNAIPLQGIEETGERRQ